MITRTHPRWILAVTIAACWLHAAPAQAQKPSPTIADLAYGDHPSQAIDFYQAESESPTPLVLYIHGGGFRNGSKSGIKAADVKALNGAGISVASVEYRLTGVKPLPAAHLDCKRALQFLRSKAGELNLDNKRIGAYGGSAGAQLCMWLAFHDEMGDPGAEDPIARESTRLACVAPSAGQITMDLNWWVQNIPGYDQPHRSGLEAFGIGDAAALAPLVKEYSPITHVSADDPPVFMTYRMHPDDPIPTGPNKASGWKIHHVAFGLALKEKLDALGVEADLKYPRGDSKYESPVAFFKAKLLAPGGD